ncbi:nucleotide-binding protein [Labrys sp. 22185]|uniref:nucleotide-binding protein n=1 Tax=Labrys sp. 22185 TaxID=3453888 RepID=UPI003F87AFFD
MELASPVTVTVSLAASKGGSGKSTLCILIGSELAQMGLKTRILCADPQHSSWKWAERCAAVGRLPDNLTVERVDDENELEQQLKGSDDHDIILIDPQGALNAVLAVAIMAADLAVAPCKASYMDAVEAKRVFDFGAKLKNANMRLVLNDVKGIDQKTGAFKEAVGHLVRNKIPYFDTVIQNRAVYAQFSNDAGTLDQLNTGPGKGDQIQRAKANIARLIEEIFAHTGIRQ